MDFEELADKLDAYAQSCYEWAGRKNFVMKYWCTPDEWNIYQMFVAPEITINGAKKIKNLHYIKSMTKTVHTQEHYFSDFGKIFIYPPKAGQFELTQVMRNENFKGIYCSEGVPHLPD